MHFHYSRQNKFLKIIWGLLFSIQKICFTSLFWVQFTLAYIHMSFLQSGFRFATNNINLYWRKKNTKAKIDIGWSNNILLKCVLSSLLDSCRKVDQTFIECFNSVLNSNLRKCFSFHLKVEANICENALLLQWCTRVVWKTLISELIQPTLLTKLYKRNAPFLNELLTLACCVFERGFRLLCWQHLPSV